VVIYANGFCLWSVMSVMGVFADWFSGAIKCIKKWLANTVMILKAWLSVKSPKMVKNVFEVFCS